MLSKITKLFDIASIPLLVYLFHLCDKNQINWFKISTKTSDKNIPTLYQIFHTYQIKNLHTNLFQNIYKHLFEKIHTKFWYIYIYIQTYIAYSFYNSLWHHHPDCYVSCRLIFLLCVCFASIYASTTTKSYILNYMWMAANFIIAGRMRLYGRTLCTVGLGQGLQTTARETISSGP